MNVSVTQDCPLCLKAATFQPNDHSFKKYFRCESCGEFIISFKADKEVRQLSAQQRQRLMRLAQRSTQTLLLRIICHSPAPQSYLGGEVSRLHAEFLPRSM